MIFKVYQCIWDKYHFSLRVQSALFQNAKLLDLSHCLVRTPVLTWYNPLEWNVPVTSEVSKGAKIRNRYNQVPHQTQDTNGKVTNSQLDTTNESQEVSPFPAGDHKAHINRGRQRHSKHKKEKNIKYYELTTLIAVASFFVINVNPDHYFNHC